MYGDIHYELVSSGSTAASANTAHLLFGSFTGLSNLNNNEVINVILQSEGGDARIGLPGSISNNLGVPVYAAASGFEWPPMRVGTASQLLFANKELGTNVTISWNIFRRDS